MKISPARLAFLLLPAFLLMPSACARPALSQATVSPKTEGSIGVAPFERVGADGAEIPDVASLLAQRLSTRGVERVVGPEQLEAAASASPDASRVVAWARDARVEALVVGRTTQLGSAISMDARLHAAASGAPLGTAFYASASGPADLAAAVDSLAGEVLTRMAPQSPGVAAAGPDRKQARRKGSGSPFRRDAPIEINSDELEAVHRKGQRRFVFTGNVRAVQGPMRLESNRLEASYPPGRSQPDRLIATGRVKIRQEGRHASCDRAVYQRATGRLVCTGNAQLEEGCDRVRGQEIVFELESEVLTVKGAADVRIHPRDGGCDGDASP